MFLPLFLFSIISIHVGECSCKPLVNCRDFWYAHFSMRHLKSQRDLLKFILQPSRLELYCNFTEIGVNWANYYLHIQQ